MFCALLCGNALPFFENVNVGVVVCGDVCFSARDGEFDARGCWQEERFFFGSGVVECDADAFGERFAGDAVVVPG